MCPNLEWQAAWSEGAIAVINGSYFDTTNGGSTTFFKKDGAIITETRSGFTWFRENVGYGLNDMEIRSSFKNHLLAGLLPAIQPCWPPVLCW